MGHQHACWFRDLLCILPRAQEEKDSWLGHIYTRPNELNGPASWWWSTAFVVCWPSPPPPLMCSRLTHYYLSCISFTSSFLLGTSDSPLFPSKNNDKIRSWFRVLSFLAKGGLPVWAFQCEVVVVVARQTTESFLWKCGGGVVVDNDNGNNFVNETLKILRHTFGDESAKRPLDLRRAGWLQPLKAICAEIDRERESENRFPKREKGETRISK